MTGIYPRKMEFIEVTFTEPLLMELNFVSVTFLQGFRNVADK